MKTSIISSLLLSFSLMTPSFAHENGCIKIHDASLLPPLVALFKPGRLVMKDGKKKGLFSNKKAKTLNKNFEKIRDYFASEHGRKSWDGKGADITASINVSTVNFLNLIQLKQNAAWIGNQGRFIFGAGSKDGLNGFEKALDVVAHEFTHAVIETSSKLVYQGQSGALNEHFADVFGSIVNQVNNPDLANPYLIGGSILNGRHSEKAQALRDMMDPAKGLAPQPAHMDDLKKDEYKKYAAGCVPSGQNDQCGVHILSGIPNKASALIMSAIGPQESASLFYNVMTKRLSANSGFADYRTAMMAECQEMSSDVCPIVDDALKAVGL